MNKFGTLLLRSTLAMAMLASLSVDVQAQVQVERLPMRPLDMNPDAVSKLRAVPTSAESRASKRDQPGWAPVAASVPLTNAAALSSFRLTFENGDHPIRSLGVLKRPDGAADLSLLDSNGDDPASAYATWQIIPGAIGGEVSTRITSGGIFQIPVPPGPVGHRLVLGGFNVTNIGSGDRFESNDTQIELISINAQDNFPQQSTNPGSSISGTIRTNNATRPINVTVQYVWIPTSFITMSSSARNDSIPPRANRPVRQVSTVIGQVPETDKYVIKSFEFEFLNGSHNLLSFGVHLNGATMPSRGNEAVSFQDNNRDDPIRWNVAFYRVN
jgi:hypothetical protein